MRAAYRVLASLVAVGVVLQAMFIALGGFTVIKDVDGGAVFDKNSDLNAGQTLHGQFGVMIIPIIALLLLIVSFFAKVDGGVKWALFVVGLVVLQVALGFLSFGAPVLGLLHGLNAFGLAGIAGMASRRAARTKSPTAETTTV